MTTLASIAPVLVRCTTIIARARGETQALALAVSRLEQLHALPFELQRATLLPITDDETDLSEVPATRLGTGLEPGSAAAAWQDSPGFSDRAAWDGHVVPVGSEFAAFVRRWAVTALGAPSGAERRLIQVFVRQRSLEDRDAAREGPVRRPGDIWLFGIRARVMR
jgi:hypothetical protein